MSFNTSGLEKFKTSINKAESVVITGHLYPDYDAVCSALLLARTLQHNYPEKNVHVVFEDRPRDGVISKESDEITIMPLLNSLHRYSADCLILTDTGYLNKATRGDREELLSHIAQKNIETLVIDHHEGISEEGLTAHIQDPAIPAATQLVYQVCFQGLSLSRPHTIDQITMLGIVDDSGLFTYPYDYSDTFKIVEELTKNGASIEQASLTMNQLTIDQMTVIAELAGNMKVKSEYAYSYVSDDFMEKKLPARCDISDFKVACTMFVNKYVKAIEGVEWGFIVYPGSLKSPREYRASFRSHANAKMDIRLITSNLGANGGHEHASGASMSAASMSSALLQVKKAISKTE